MNFATQSPPTPDDQLAELLEALSSKLREQPATSDALISDAVPDNAELRQLLAVVQLLNRLGQGATGSSAADATRGREQPDIVLEDFRILEEIGRGGMGIVYAAKQLSLDRHVAVKILPGTASLEPKRLRRFENEARAAATLEHPHIVPVYATGCVAGLHYYAMRLVVGKSAAQIIVERGHGKSMASLFSAAQLGGDLTEPSVYHRFVAGLGRQAAAALQHAHESGIVHRDIKPSNLLVSEEGHLFVTDFGLAHGLNDVSLTQPGDVVGTIRYLPPEKTLDRQPLVDHRADIYSLGVTLYEMLALRPAFPADNRRELLHQIARHQPLPLQRIDKHIPTPLRNIVKRAMAEHVDDRYATARQLEDDLQKFLEGKPVGARPVGVVFHFRKLLRRRTKLLLVLFVFLWAAGMTLIASVIIVARERDQARAAEARHDELRQLAESQRKDAERDRQQADANFKLARDAVDRIFRTAAYELDGLPVEATIRESLLNDVLEYYQQFLQQESTNKTVRFDLATAFEHVGRIQHQLGNDDEAEQAIAQAAELLRQLVEDHPGHPEYPAKMAELLVRKSHICLERLGCCQLTRGLENSLQHLAEATGLLEGLLEEQPDKVELVAQLAANHLARASVLRELHRVAEAEGAYGQVIRCWEQVRRQQLASQEALAGLAAAHHQWGALIASQGRRREAQSQLMEALRLCEQLTATMADAQSKWELASINRDLAALLMEEVDYDEAQTHLRRASRICEQLVRAAPSETHSKSLLAECHFDEYRLAMAFGDAATARRALDQSTDHLTELIELTNGSLRTLLSASRNHSLSAWRLYEAGDREGARYEFDKTRDLLESGVARFPYAPKAKAQLAWLLATCPLDKSSRDERLSRAIELAQQALEADPSDSHHRRILAVVQFFAGDNDACADALHELPQPTAEARAHDAILRALTALREDAADVAVRQYREARKRIDSRPWLRDPLTPLLLAASYHPELAAADDNHAADL